MEMTPGEWRAVGPDEPYGDITIQADEQPGKVIARLIQDDAPEPEYNRLQWANAYAMASVPFLHAVARGVLTAMKYPRGSEAQIRCLEEVGQDAEYAMKKLEGQSS